MGLFGTTSTSDFRPKKPEVVPNGGLFPPMFSKAGSCVIRDKAESQKSSRGSFLRFPTLIPTLPSKLGGNYLLFATRGAKPLPCAPLPTPNRNPAPPVRPSSSRAALLLPLRATALPHPPPTRRPPPPPTRCRAPPPPPMSRRPVLSYYINPLLG